MWIFTTEWITISLIINTEIIFVESPKWSNLSTRTLYVSQGFFSHCCGFNLSLRTTKLQKEEGNMKSSKHSLVKYKTSSNKSQLLSWVTFQGAILPLSITIIFEKYTFSCYDYPSKKLEYMIKKNFILLYIIMTALRFSLDFAPKANTSVN